MKKSIATSIILSTAIASTDYISGEIKTKKAYTYGKFITRMQAPAMYGTVSSFFTYWNGPNWYDGGWNEIDVEIVPSMAIQNTSTFSTNIIYGSGTNYHMEDHVYEPISNPTDFHIYEIEWTPDYIQWKVDDIVKRTVYAGAASVNFMNKPNVLMMNFWTPTWSPWGDGRNDSSMPWYVLYDYVEAYTYNTSTKQFSLDFRDDFSGASVNTGIWTLSDWWNFGGSSTMFLASQAYQENGNLVLKMEKHYYAMDASDLINQAAATQTFIE